MTEAPKPLAIGIFGVHGTGKSKIANSLRSKFETLDYRVGFVEEQATALKLSGEVELNQATTIESQLKILHSTEQRFIEESQKTDFEYNTPGGQKPHVVIMDRLWLCNHAYLEAAINKIFSDIEAGNQLNAQELEDLNVFGAAYPEELPFKEDLTLRIINKLENRRLTEPEKEYLRGWYNSKMSKSIQLWVIDMQIKYVDIALKSGYFPIDSALMTKQMANETRALEDDFRVAIAHKIEAYSRLIKSRHPEFRIRNLDSPYRMQACETEAELRYSIASVVAQADSIAMTEVRDLLTIRELQQ